MIKQVSVSSATKAILTPSQQMKVGVIQNNGSVAVRLSIDGGSAHGGQDPTTTTGFKLAAGKEVDVNTVWGGSGLHKPIVGVSEGADVTLDVITDDMLST